MLNRKSWVARLLCVGAIVGAAEFGIGKASAVLVYTGGNGIVSFGVADYLPPVPQAFPTYIPNNFTFLNDVMTSPGNGFLTADTSIPNNIASWGGALPGGAWQIGGGTGNGNFGWSGVSITGPNVGFALTDGNPDGAGAASYAIASWNASYTNVGALNNITYGNSLAITGHLTSPVSAIAVSLRTHVVDSMGVWGAGIDLPQLVLAAAGNPNSQALGGPFGLDAGMNINLITGNYFGLAFNNLGPVNIPHGDVITVTTTLTVIGDPASIDVFFDLDSTPLTLDQLNPNWANTNDATPMLPSTSLAGMADLPEPSSLALLGVGAFLMIGRRKRGSAA